MGSEAWPLRVVHVAAVEPAAAEPAAAVVEAAVVDSVVVVAVVVVVGPEIGRGWNPFALHSTQTARSQ
jgi:hypothetical protein